MPVRCISNIHNYVVRLRISPSSCRNSPRGWEFESLRMHVALLPAYCTPNISCASVFNHRCAYLIPFNDLCSFSRSWKSCDDCDCYKHLHNRPNDEPPSIAPWIKSMSKVVIQLEMRAAQSPLRLLRPSSSNEAWLSGLGLVRFYVPVNEKYLEDRHRPFVIWMRLATTILQVKETTRDVKFLHNETFFATAQRKYCYIYDKRGIEIHCLKVSKPFLKKRNFYYASWQLAHQP